MHVILGMLGVRVGELHGDMKQPQRLYTLKKFKNEDIDVLLATDVAARGLDIKGVKTVINFTMPFTPEQYIHRVGRTARAGRSGRSVSIAGEKERKMVREIIKRARDPVKARVIPSEIVEKYKKKLKEIDEDAKHIINEEAADKQLTMLENKTKHLEVKLAGQEVDEGRVWFQTKDERKEELKKIKVIPKNYF